VQTAVSAALSRLGAVGATRESTLLKLAVRDAKGQIVPTPWFIAESRRVQAFKRRVVDAQRLHGTFGAVASASDADIATQLASLQDLHKQAAALSASAAWQQASAAAASSAPSLTAAEWSTEIGRVAVASTSLQNSSSSAAWASLLSRLEIAGRSAATETALAAVVDRIGAEVDARSTEVARRAALVAAESANLHVSLLHSLEQANSHYQDVLSKVSQGPLARFRV
jgi:hypothetical protein